MRVSVKDCVIHIIYSDQKEYELHNLASHKFPLSWEDVVVLAAGQEYRVLSLGKPEPVAHTFLCEE